MKVCHVVHQSWPAVCGSVSRLENILEAQRRKGVDVFVVSSPFQEPNLQGAKLESNRGVRYFRHQRSGCFDGVRTERTLWQRLKRALSLFFFTLALLKICKRERPDIIHAHATFAVGFPAWIVASLLRLKFVYEMRSTWEEDITGGRLIGLQRYLIKRLEAFVASRSDRIVFVSRGIMSHYFSRSPSNGAVLYNCVSLPRSVRLQDNCGIFSFGYIGSIVSYEGLDHLIKASAALEDRYSNFEVHIYGDGPQRNHLEAMARSLNCKSIRFHGRIEYDLVGEAYSKIDCIVLPRKKLPITDKVAGLKPIEAFAYRKLVVASDVGGMREIFCDRTHGLFFEADNTDALTDLMEKVLLDQVPEVDLMKDRAFELYQKNFTIDSMGLQYCNLYLEALNEN